VNVAGDLAALRWWRDAAFFSRLAVIEMQLEAMAVKIPHVEGHPNRVPFEGVLTIVDSASDRAPAGARGHRVLLTRAAAEKALASLRDGAWLTTGALVVVEEAKAAGFAAPEGFEELERRAYDDTEFVFLRAG